MIKLANIYAKMLNEAPADDLANIVDMPISQFVSQFKALASDPKVKSVLNAGLTDGNPGDEKMSVGSGTLSVSKLRPTQNIIGQAESLNNILDNKYGSLDKFLAGSATFPTPIITYNGQYIIDGHHRWSQVYAANPEAKVPVMDIKGKLEPLDVLKAVHMAIAADIGDLPLSSAKGINMLDASEQAIKDVVTQNLKDNVLEIYKKYGKGDTPEAVAEYIWGNIKRMQSNNAPISGAPDRSAMPQTDEAPNFSSLLAKGTVNFVGPKPDDIQNESIKKWQKLAGIIKD